MLLSDKQKYTLNLCLRAPPRVTLLSGAVRSGKTFASLLAFASLVAKMPKNATYLMSGKTLTTLRRNCLEPLLSIVGDKVFSFSTHRKSATLFGRKIFLEGSSDNRAEYKIRGLTLNGAFCDELSLFSEDFYLMLLSRLSQPRAFLIASTNPDSPFHWLKKRIDAVDSEITSINFSIDDNPFLDKEYIASIKNEFSGVFYDRFIRGLWIAAEGRVFPSFNPKLHVKTLDDFSPAFANIGVDFGGNNSASSFILTLFEKNFKRIFVAAEFFDPINLSSEKLIADFKDFCSLALAICPSINSIFCDSAEQLLIKSFRNNVRHLNLNVRNAAKSPVLQRIRLSNFLLSSNRLFISPACTHLIDALNSALWNPKKDSSRLDDGSTNIDSLDAFEYSIEKFSNDLLKSVSYNN